MNIKEFVSRPDNYLLTFGPDHGVLVPMDRDAYFESIFCDMRIKAKSNQGATISFDELNRIADLELTAPPSVSYIFHIAHCGSTLLARALDLKNENIVYREPITLRQLGIERGDAGPDNAAWKNKLRIATSLLSRRYAEDGPAIVKANIPVNFIAPELLALSPNNPHIVLYFPLEYYLLAILRSPNHRQRVGNMINELQHMIRPLAPLSADMTIAQAAGSLWLAQMRMYADALANYPTVASLNAEDLFETPGPVLAAAFAHFGQPQPQEKIDAIVAGDLFARYSKNPDVEFDNSSRLSRRAQLLQTLKPEITEARNWLAAPLRDNPLPRKFGNPLYGEAPDLMMRVA